jgi:hypothetical protein
MDLKVEILGTGPETIVRTGAAAPIYDPIPVVLTGTIKAPGDFLANRLNAIVAAATFAQNTVITDTPPQPLKSDSELTLPAKSKCNVVADYAKRTIKLRWDERDKFATEVTGTLRLNPALEALTINAKKTYNHRELLNLIKFQGAYFADRKDHDDLIKSLKAFEAIIGIEFKDADDYKGTAGQSKLTKITHDIPLEMKLTMPIFGGGDKETFKVDVCVGLVSGSVDFWLESTVLDEMIIVQTEKIFEEELKRFDGIVIVKQY